MIQSQVCRSLTERSFRAKCTDVALESWPATGLRQIRVMSSNTHHHVRVFRIYWSGEAASSSAGASEPVAASSNSPCSSLFDSVAWLVLSVWTPDISSLESLGWAFRSKTELSSPCVSHGCSTTTWMWASHSSSQARLMSIMNIHMFDGETKRNANPYCEIFG